MAFVSLPMYSFAETTEANAALGKALASALTRRGEPARWSEPTLPDHSALEAHWLSPDLALSQACGLPLVEALSGRVSPVGTWNWSGVTDKGRYRSVIVGRRGWKPTGPALRTAVNGWHSLSGWASLGVFLAESSLTSGPPVVTGSHRASLAALTRGEADLAAIDGVTWSLAGRFWPNEVSGLSVFGKGPEIPALPLITRAEFSPPIWATILEEALRAAPEARSVGIEGFTPLTLEDFRALPALAEKAETILPRPQGLRRHS